VVRQQFVNGLFKKGRLQNMDLRAEPSQRFRLPRLKRNRQK